MCAFITGKKNRGVLSKQIIWESGVSKSQFYRIMSGKENPSPETKSRISKSLNIKIDEFDLLHARSNLKPEANDFLRDRKHLRKPLFFLISILLTSAIGLAAINSQRSIESSVGKVVTNPNDKTLFIKDVTVPDGTAIPVDTTFVKTWRVKNVGTVIWKNRYLKRITSLSNQICSSPAMVPIPETLPGETVDISVTFTTPHLPGSCRTDWKSADENGNLHFPDMHGLFSIVTVIE